MYKWVILLFQQLYFCVAFGYWIRRSHYLAQWDYRTWHPRVVGKALRQDRKSMCVCVGGRVARMYRHVSWLIHHHNHPTHQDSLLCLSNGSYLIENTIGIDIGFFFSEGSKSGVGVVNARKLNSSRCLYVWTCEWMLWRYMCMCVSE